MLLIFLASALALFIKIIRIKLDNMKFNHHFYKTNSFLFGFALILAPVIDLITDQDIIGRILDLGCQLFGALFLIASLFKRHP